MTTYKIEATGDNGRHRPRRVKDTNLSASYRPQGILAEVMRVCRPDVVNAKNEMVGSGVSSVLSRAIVRAKAGR